MLLHFLRPYWFLAILPVLFLVWQLNRRTFTGNWSLVCDAHLLSHLVVMPQSKLRLPLFLFAIGSLFAIFSLAGPSWRKLPQPIYRPQNGRILVLNLSPSMADPLGTVKKIDRARFKLLDFLKQQREGLTGLVVYTDEAHIISPLTEDTRTIANFVPWLDPSIMPTYNDDITVGLKQAQQLLQQADLNEGNIIIITDKITHVTHAKQLAAVLFHHGYRVYIFDISGQSAARSAMQAVANAGGGRVITLTPNNKDIQQLLTSTHQDALFSNIRKTQEKSWLWQDEGRIFIIFILPLALLAFRRGYL